MSSVSGLRPERRALARQRAADAALLGVRNSSLIHYTQGERRWSGIDNKLIARKGQFPKYADCSAFVTWCLWNGLYVPYGVRDTVNASGWRSGYTGTMLEHGKRVVHLKNVLRGDAVLYGRPGSAGAHTAIVVGRRADGKIMVVSHGSEPGPFYVPYDYRSDVMCFRRYI